MIINEAYQQLINNLIEIYDKREAKNIADLVIEKFTGYNKGNRILFKQNVLTREQEQLYKNFSGQLLQHKPVQYVLNEAWFAGIKLYVDENVLIPRPETEELVEWIISDFRLQTSDFKFQILDIGTGSGCIAIALKEKLSYANLYALDVSDAALKVASKNAKVNNTAVNFFKTDLNQSLQKNDFPFFDIIVSNPPYITENEKYDMNENVLSYEPRLALFVPNSDPLLFYNSISNFAVVHLKPNGSLYFEINPSFANEVADLLRKKSFQSIEIKNDLQGKQRMIKAVYKNY